MQRTTQTRRKLGRIYNSSTTYTLTLIYPLTSVCVSESDLYIYTLGKSKPITNFERNLLYHIHRLIHNLTFVDLRYKVHNSKFVHDFVENFEYINIETVHNYVIFKGRKCPPTNTEKKLSRISQENTLGCIRFTTISVFLPWIGWSLRSWVWFTGLLVPT